MAKNYFIYLPLTIGSIEDKWKQRLRRMNLASSSPLFFGDIVYVTAMVIAPRGVKIL